MAFPRKFKSLLETTQSDIINPDCAHITFSVCGCTPDACGWSGWALEVVTSKEESNPLPADDNLKCPICGKDLFRTSATLRMIPSPDQTPELVLGKDYTSSPMKYED